MKIKKLLPFSLAALSVIAVSSIGITLAYFNSGVINNIDGIDLVLKGDPTLLISTSGKSGTFKETLNEEDLMKVPSFIPVSSMYSNNTPRFVSNQSHLKDPSKALFVDDGFFRQELYLQSNNNVYVTLDKKLFSFSPNIAKNEKAYEKVKDKYPDLSKDEIMNNLNNITKSLRVSIYFEDQGISHYLIVDPYKNEETYFCGSLDLDVNKYYDFTGNNKETVFGDYDDENKLVYDPASPVDIKPVGQVTCFNSGHKANVDIFNLEKSIDAGLTVGKENSVNLDQVESALTIPLRNQDPTKITLSIYLEGWDKDNTNLAESASFYANLAFMVKGEII